MMDDKRELSAKSGNMFSAFGDANAGGMIEMSKRFTKSPKDLKIMDDKVSTLFDSNTRQDGSKKLVQKDIAEIISFSFHFHFILTVGLFSYKG